MDIYIYIARRIIMKNSEKNEVKKIWILNHYATKMYDQGGGRHFEIAHELDKSVYSPTIFCANTLHSKNDDIYLANNKFTIKYGGKIPFVFVKTSPYSSNGISRILNMYLFSKNVYKVGIHLAKAHGKPDVIIASSVHPLTLVAGKRLANKLKVPIISEIRDLWPETLVQMDQIKRNGLIARLMYKLEENIYKESDAVVFTIPGGGKYLESKVGKRKNVEYINNGVNLAKFQKSIRDYKYTDTDLDDSEYFKVVYTGSMGNANELIDLIGLAEETMRQSKKKIKYILFGDGPKREMLEKITKEKSLTNVVFKGNVEKKYIPSILNKSDLNIMVGKDISLYEYGLSLNKMFEYFASGKPTISNIKTGYDLLEQYRCGMTVSPTLRDLYDGVLYFYNLSRSEYNVYCSNALRASEDFDFKVLSNKYERLIEKVI